VEALLGMNDVAGPHILFCLPATVMCLFPLSRMLLPAAPDK
jgi:hypothetical protein